MRLFIVIMFFSLIYIASCKTNVKTLTGSMGQEVIEIAAPIKELPVGLEEEPSGENDDDDDDKPKVTTSITLPATKKEIRKTATLAAIRKNMKDIEKIDGINQEDEEARIEKELSEIYKDTADYKSDSAEEKDVAMQEPSVEPTIEPPSELTDEPAHLQPIEDLTSGEDTDKPIGRQKANFKFEPDSTQKADIEKFRTSIDEIRCNQRQRLVVSTEEGDTNVVPNEPPPKNNKAFHTISNCATLITAALGYVFVCT